MDIKTNSSPSASLLDAQRHEAGARWLESARAYLSTLVSTPHLKQVALAGLKRCAQRDISDEQSEVGDDSQYREVNKLLLMIGLIVAEEWREAVLIGLSQDDQDVQHLSPSMQQRWPHLYHKLNESLLSESLLSESLDEPDHQVLPHWIIILVMLERLARHNMISDLLMMVRESLQYIPNELHQALINYEAGRIALNHQHLSSGGYFFTQALRLAPSLNEDIIQRIDSVIIQSVDHINELESDLAYLQSFDSYDELLGLRCQHLKISVLELWVNELGADPLVQGKPLFMLWLGSRLEKLSQQNTQTHRSPNYASGAFLAYALTLERSHSNGDVYQKAFLSMTGLVLARQKRPGHLDDDEPTLDNIENHGELVEEGENRFILQLKEHKSYDYILYFLKQKAEAVHLPNRERAIAYNALAQLSLSHKNGLKSAIDYIVKGAEFDPKQLKLSSLMREARASDDWSALEPLLDIQLKLTQKLAKRMMILSMIAQGQRQQAEWFKSYQTLMKLGAEEYLSSSSNTEPDHVNPFLISFSKETEKEISSLLRVKGAALAIGRQLSSQERWPELIRLLERLEYKGKVSVELLENSVNHAVNTWSFAEPLLSHYEQDEKWSEWLELILTVPKKSWPLREQGRLISQAVERAKKLDDENYSALLRLRAVWLNESMATDQERIEAWVAYLKEHPADLDAIEALEPLISRTANWSTLADLYANALPLRKTGKIRILERLFHIYTEFLNQRDEAAQVQHAILELDSSHEEAGTWLTLYYAERQAWKELLKACTLWRPKVSKHPVWLEAKVRALIGLESLELAYQCWSELSQESVKRSFLEPMLSLAETQKQGLLTLDLLDLLDQVVGVEGFDSLEDIEQEDPLSFSPDESPPPLPDIDEVFNEAEQSVSEDEHLTNLLTGDYKTAFSHEHRLRLRAKALFMWLEPKDPILALQAWEAVQAQYGLDDESAYALVKLYSTLGQRRELIKLLSFVEDSAAVVLKRRRSIILAALHFETRFKEYTEAFKCWLALYEHSPKDREICVSAFYRLSTSDKELQTLLIELLKLRSEHSKSLTLSVSTALEFAQNSNQSLFQKEIAYKILKTLVFNDQYGDQALSLLLKLTQELGVWEDTVQVLAQSKNWRLLWLAAHLSECRLGEHESAKILYDMAITYLERSYQKRSQIEQGSRLFLESKKMISASLSRLENFERKAKDSLPPPLELQIEFIDDDDQSLEHDQSNNMSTEVESITFEHVSSESSEQEKLENTYEPLKYSKDEEADLQQLDLPNKDDQTDEESMQAIETED